jgi:hypothetical protein
MVRFLVDPNQPRQLVGTILEIPQGDARSFQNEQDLLRQIYILLENRISQPELKRKNADE